MSFTFMAAITIAVILKPSKIKSATVSTVSPTICHDMMGLNVMILVFWRVLSQLFHSLLALSSRGFLVPLHFLSFIELIFAWNDPLVSLIFLKQSIVFPILLFSSISLHWSLRKAFLSLLPILWNSVFKWYNFPFLLCFSLLFFSQLFVRVPQTASTLCLHFFFWGMVLIPGSCKMSYKMSPLSIVHQTLYQI